MIILNEGRSSEVMYEYSFYIQATSQRMVGLKLSLISGFIESHPSVSVTFEGKKSNCNQPMRKFTFRF